MRVLLFFIVFLISLSCSQKRFNTKEGLLEYIQYEDNGYIQNQTVNGIDYCLAYRPTDLLVLQEMNSNKLKISIDDLRNKYGKFIYINLSISRNNLELLSTIPNNFEEYSALMSHLSFGMNEKISLFTEKNDTLQLVDYINPRTYGLSNRTSVLFVYSREKLMTCKELNFIIKDMGLGTGNVKFKILTQNIINEPKLSFENLLNEKDI